MISNTETLLPGLCRGRHSKSYPTIIVAMSVTAAKSILNRNKKNKNLTGNSGKREEGNTKQFGTVLRWMKRSEYHGSLNQHQRGFRLFQTGFTDLYSKQTRTPQRSNYYGN